MSSDKCTWISTDRKTESEVLKELAVADTPVVIVSRDQWDRDAYQSMADGAMPSSLAQAIVLSKFSPRKLLRSRPENFKSLIQSPWDCSYIIDSREKTSYPIAATLHDWLLERLLTKRDPVRNFYIETETLPQPLAVAMHEVEQLDFPPLRPLRDPIRRALTPTKPKLSEFLRTQIDRLAGLEIPADSIDAIALRAGIYLWHDAMDESHELAQSIEGKGQHHNGDYVHAILHRREPDYANAKYWFRHVGRHPNFERLGQEAGPLIEQHAPEWKSRLLKGGWDPFAFADFCEQAVATQNPQWIACAEMIQEIELLLLLASTGARPSWWEHD